MPAARIVLVPVTHFATTTPLGKHVPSFTLGNRRELLNSALAIQYLADHMKASRFNSGVRGIDTDLERVIIFDLVLLGDGVRLKTVKG